MLAATQSEVLRVPERHKGPDRISPEATINAQKRGRTYGWANADQNIPTNLVEGKLSSNTKAQKQKGDPETHRPICFLDTPAKLFEHLILDRLNDEKERIGHTSAKFQKKQYEAIEEVIGRANTAILLDVTNAFNTASWQ